MSDKKVNSVEKQGKFKALKNEFNKIMWPDKQSVVNKTIAVVAVSTALALIIAGFDYTVKALLNVIMG